MASLAREYHVHHEWLAKALDRWASARGIKNHRTRRYPRPRAQCDQSRKSVVDDRATVIRWYLEEELSLRELANRYGVQPPFIRDRLIEWNVTLRPHYSRKPEDVPQKPPVVEV